MNGRAILSGIVVLLFAVAAILTAVFVPKQEAKGATTDPILSLHTNSLTTYLAAATSVQGATPLATQRGVGIDGASRNSAGLPLAIAGNPFESPDRATGVRATIGHYELTKVDLTLPSTGPDWVIGRTFNALDGTNANGPQGKNWHQLSQAEIVFYNNADDELDMVYLVYGADRYVEYKRISDASERFYGKNGAAGVMERAAGSPDIWTLSDQNGNKIYFAGFNTADADHYGQLWKIVDPAGNVAFVGDASSITTALSSGYDSNGRILYAYDASDRRYVYGISGAIGGSTRYQTITAQTKTSGSWSSPSGVKDVGRVTYAYYTSDGDAHGVAGDLKSVTIETTTTDSDDVDTTPRVEVEYYRYYDDTWSNSDGRRGQSGQLKMIVDAEGTRNYDRTDSNTFDADYVSASDTTLLPYSEVYLEYGNGDRRVVKAVYSGCGCGGSDGTIIYEYEDNGNYDGGDAADGYTNFWWRRTIMQDSIGRWDVIYTDEVGQRLSGVVTDADPDGATNFWATQVTRNAAGQITEIATPAANDDYDHSTGEGSITQEASAGLIHVYTRSAGSNAVDGFRVDQKYKIGSSGTACLVDTLAYDTNINLAIGGDAHIIRPLIASRRIFNVPGTTSGTSGSVLWSYAYTAHSSTIAVKTIVTTEPAVTTASNGSNSSNTISQYFNTDGNLAYTKDAGANIEYRAYTNGQLTTLARDADTTALSPPTGFDETGTPLNQVTTYSYDAGGRLATEFTPDSRELVHTYTYLLDRRFVELVYSDKVSSTYYGPVSYYVTNHAGRAEATATLKYTSGGVININEATADAIDAAPDNTVTGLVVQNYAETGSQLLSTWSFHLTPATFAGAAENTNYDISATYTYDAAGRQVAVEDATGTIRERAYDIRGNVNSRSTGTDTSGGGGDNMVVTAEYTIDGGTAGGNSYVTSMTEYVTDSSTGARTTDYTNDAWGKPLLVTREASYPKQLTKYDNRHRATATGLYSSGSSPSGDPESVTSGRLALTVTTYDELDRAFKTTRHKIDDADGSSDDTLVSESWFDSRGRRIKTDGQQLVKYAYDRLNRQTNEYILSHDNDSTTYANMEGVSGDIVLQENQTIYAYPTTHDRPIGELTVHRPHNDTSTAGALHADDSDSLLLTAAHFVGRPQITVHWYDANHLQLTDTVEYGTNGGSNLDLDGLACPSRSLTAHRTTFVYDSAGRVQTVTDPRSKVQLTGYDDAGRRTTVIANYIDGTPNDPDGDQKTVYTYDNGLLESILSDLPATDQLTTYSYGTTKGSNPNSRIATGHLPSLVTYPDSGGAGDDVEFAYNAQEEVVYRRDQAANVLEYSFDDAGRPTTTEATTISGGFDNYVTNVVTTYTSLSQVNLVTQLQSSIRDQVRYTYDDWGNVAEFDQNHTNAVGGGGIDYNVTYSWAKATTGRNTLRRTLMTYDNGNALAYNYNATIDANSSRVSSVQFSGGAVLAAYTYLGVDNVVRTYHDEPDVFSALYNLGTNAYDNLGRFNEPISWQWTKDLGTDKDFCDVDFTYDENLNVTVANDVVFAGRDVSYTNDGLSRLSRADEGTWNGSAITSRTRDEQWVLNTGDDLTRCKLDLNGNGNFGDANECDDTRSFNSANELGTRNTNSAGGVEYTLTHDAVGNITNDGKIYTYKYDVWNRLTQVKQGATVIANYQYNGLGYRITEQKDSDSDGDVDGSDLVYHFVYDAEWRQIATYRSTDGAPKEHFYYHQAGLGGGVATGDLDKVICQQRDADTAWNAAPNGNGMERRYYYCQNWRNDVVAIVESSGMIVEWVKYSSYGVPFGMPGGDTDNDGDCDVTDVNQIQTWINGSTYNILGDLDLDGDVDNNDKARAQGVFQGTNLGRGNLTATAVGNKKGYAGYEWDSKIDQKYHVRNRVLSAELGQWMTRDPAGFADSMNLYAYAAINPISALDPYGLAVCDARKDCPPGTKPDPSQVENCKVYYTAAVALCFVGLGQCLSGCKGPGAPVCVAICGAAFVAGLLIACNMYKGCMQTVPCIPMTPAEIAALAREERNHEAYEKEMMGGPCIPGCHWGPDGWPPYDPKRHYGPWPPVSGGFTDPFGGGTGNGPAGPTSGSGGTGGCSGGGCH